MQYFDGEGESIKFRFRRRHAAVKCEFELLDIARGRNKRLLEPRPFSVYTRKTATSRGKFQAGTNTHVSRRCLHKAHPVQAHYRISLMSKKGGMGNKTRNATCCHRKSLARDERVHLKQAKHKRRAAEKSEHADAERKTAACGRFALTPHQYAVRLPGRAITLRSFSGGESGMWQPD